MNINLDENQYQKRCSDLNSIRKSIHFNWVSLSGLYTCSRGRALDERGISL